MENKIEKIEELAQILEKYGLTSVEVDQGELKVILKKEVHLIQPSNIAGGMISRNRTPNDFRHITEQKSLQDEIVSVKEPIIKSSQNKPNNRGPKHDNTDENEIAVKTPVAGIFYRQSAPGKPPYVVEGQHVKKGDTLCLVEAMKMINEIVANNDGVVKDILVENEEFVEFDRELIILTKE